MNGIKNLLRLCTNIVIFSGFSFSLFVKFLKYISIRSNQMLNFLKIYGFEVMTFSLHGSYLEAIIRGQRYGFEATPCG